MNDENNKVEYTYVMIKPDVAGNELCVRAIKRMLENSGMEIVLDYRCQSNPNGYYLLSEQQLEHHYGHVKKYGEDVYNKLVKFMKSGYVIPMVLKGVNAIKKVRDIVGPTDSTQAEITTIRGLFGTDKRMNAIHASDSVESAKEEISRFFDGTTIEDLDNKYLKEKGIILTKKKINNNKFVLNNLHKIGK